VSVSDESEITFPVAGGIFGVGQIATRLKALSSPNNSPAHAAAAGGRLVPV
jgi:hypothetical protein